MNCDEIRSSNIALIFLDELDEFGVSKKIHRTVLNKEINHQVNGTSFLVFKQMFNIQFNFL